MDEIRRLLKTIRKVSKSNPATYMQLSEIIRTLWRPRPKVTSIYQEAHGFIVGDVIKPADPLWIKAKADSETNAKAAAVVCEIIDEDHFVLLQQGLIPGEYTIGAKYFLSLTTAGAVFIQSDPEEWVVGNYRQMIGTGTADGLLVEIDEGSVIAAALDTSVFQIDFIFDDAGTITYPCAYALKFTEMIHQQANEPTLSHALNTDLAQYTAFEMTADAAGIVTLTGQWL